VVRVLDAWVAAEISPRVTCKQSWASCHPSASSVQFSLPFLCCIPLGSWSRVHCERKLVFTTV